jgi:hypothetical protein
MAAEMDARLHSERLSERRKRIHAAPIEGLPDGAMIERDGRAFAINHDQLLPWSFHGYAEPVPRPRRGLANVLTPPSIVAALSAGYAPRWNAPASPGARLDASACLSPNSARLAG